MRITLTMPNTPILVMMPDRGADTDEGAAGWASGSQECRGTRPALTPKPARQSTRAVWNQNGKWKAASGAAEKTPRMNRPGSMNSAPPAHIT